MAVNLKKRRTGVAEINMASISDIVFLLLVYFMVVTVFQQDMGLPFVLPAGGVVTGRRCISRTFFGEENSPTLSIV